MSKKINQVLSSTKEITLGENTFTIKPMTLGDLTDFQNWCDVKKKQEVIDVYVMAGQVPDVKEIMTITGDDDYYQTSMASIEGIVFLLEKAIHKTNDTDITSRQITDLIAIEQLQDITEFLFERYISEDTPSKNKAAKPRLKK